MAEKKVITSFDDLTYRIIGCAMAVHREHGTGLRENSYQRALAFSLQDAGLRYEPQKLYSVYDDPKQQRLVGYYIPDFVVEEKIIVEIKALKGLDNSHLAQVIHYLAVSACPLGLLINFGERSLRYRRIFPPKNVSEHLINRQWLFVPDWLKPDWKTDT
ncbi:MAG TPA: GxxExxY protein [Anaerolineales bacterium]|nr:GxxExxY protein [Anaerolineales bacterium]